VIILEGEDKNFLFLEKLSGESLVSSPSEVSFEEGPKMKDRSLAVLLEKLEPNEKIKKWSEGIHEILTKEYYSQDLLL